MMLKQAENALVEMILLSDMDIIQVKDEWLKQYEELIHIEQLADIWNDVMDTLPELN